MPSNIGAKLHWRNNAHTNHFVDQPRTKNRSLHSAVDPYLSPGFQAAHHGRANEGSRGPKRYTVRTSGLAPQKGSYYEHPRQIQEVIETKSPMGERHTKAPGVYYIAENSVLNHHPANNQRFRGAGTTLSAERTPARSIPQTSHACRAKRTVASRISCTDKPSSYHRKSYI